MITMVIVATNRAVQARNTIIFTTYLTILSFNYYLFSDCSLNKLAFQLRSDIVDNEDSKERTRSMFPSAVADIEDFQAHQRKIVRSFAPHLSNAALTVQERIYFALCLARIVLVFLLPSCAIFYLHDAFLETPAFALVSVVCVLELVLAMVRPCYCV